MPIVDLLEAEAILPQLLDALERGEETEFIIVRDGTPVARLLPPNNDAIASA